MLKIAKIKTWLFAFGCRFRFSVFRLRFRLSVFVFGYRFRFCFTPPCVHFGRAWEFAQGIDKYRFGRSVGAV